MGKRGPKPGSGGRPPKKKEAVKGFSEKDLSLFEKFLNIIRGKVDVKHRLKLLLDPEPVETTTILSQAERDFVSVCYFLPKYFPSFEPMKEYAKQHCLTSISLQGQGREDAIRFTSAISESKLMKQLGIFKTETKEAS